MKILVSALEHSANIHLTELKKELIEDIEFIGIFDKRLGSPIIDIDSLSIMGFVDAIKKIKFYLNLNTKMLNLAEEADKILLIDSSGFNLPLAKRIKKKYPNKEIIYYILPQAWAWKKKRILVLEKNIDVLASILPFEKEYYSKSSTIQYVGHPLLDEINEFKTKLTNNGSVVFMPGSRAGEIKNLMPIYREVAKKIDKHAVIVIPSNFSEEQVDELYGDLSDFKIAHDSYKALLHGDEAFICSGTATLEASLIGIPFILTYKAKTLDYLIVKKLIKLKFIGLANIMFSNFKNRPMHLELLQNNVTIDNLLDSYRTLNKENFLDDSYALRTYLSNGSSKVMKNILESTK